ncbi:Rossmann-like and DUF2520 domain-containing protein [Arachidicoccus sp.]|uniref:Rossmann-like and DUF2520 domain-containing protein n=1 Tax=Arachidicoccus sp. TaxID=1872624 RepID=UPI003D21807B
MKIVIIGTGNVATILGKKMAGAHHTILQVMGRSERAAAVLASALKCTYSLELTAMEQEADIYFICVQDKEINAVVAQMKVPENAMVVHTAGGISIQVLAGMFRNYGIVYPLQSLRKEVTVLPVIPFFVDANNEHNCVILSEFAKTMSAQVHRANDIQRMKLHLAAVFTSNFTNYLYSLANDYCTASQINFSFLQPLIVETASRLQQFAPSEIQTGPAVRGDTLTLEKHLAMLNDFEEAQEVYRFLSKKIQMHFKD